ncbi:hypothetical protein ACFTXM_33855 [Streptomyces sp. NPDC056930]|uniref:hypothetical protein n=1 Tax=Streptomyces sp. NPDC056930 TaxID=3345967 RepID=UPI003625B069
MTLTVQYTRRATRSRRQRPLIAEVGAAADCLPLKSLGAGGTEVGVDRIGRIIAEQQPERYLLGCEGGEDGRGGLAGVPLLLAVRAGEIRPDGPTVTSYAGGAAACRRPGTRSRAAMGIRTRRA